ncbi:MAG: K+-transporting ATPase, c chain [Acidobacteriaceae bacterium]|nr:K+-transporting ATPase, c chain [Acidobacteriaceae bacterium]
MLRNEFKIAVRFTLITAVVLGIFYPLAVTGIGHVAFRHQADGNLIVANGQDGLAADRAKLYRGTVFS